MSAPIDVAVVRTGTANLASVFAGLERVGARPHLVSGASEVTAARRLVVPGVGTFGASVAELETRGLIEPLRERIESGAPTLAICLGLQLLAASSEESPGVRGLAVVPGAVTRFPRQESLRVPQLGWNRIEAAAECRLLASGWVYFANSFRLTEVPPGCSAAIADHGGPFVAAFERGALLACQFHPELSGAFGLSLLARWIAQPSPGEAV